MVDRCHHQRQPDDQPTRPAFSVRTGCFSSILGLLQLGRGNQLHGTRDFTRVLGGFYASVVRGRWPWFSCPLVQQAQDKSGRFGETLAETVDGFLELGFTFVAENALLVDFGDQLGVLFVHELEEALFEGSNLFHLKSSSMP